MFVSVLLPVFPIGAAALADEKPKQFEGNRPEKVAADKDGVLVLPATRCAVYGTTLQYMPEDRALGYWNSKDDHADWTIEVARPGKYEVWYEWSCHDDSSGNTYLLTVGKSELRGVVPTTKLWTNHLRQKFGTVELPEGESKLSIKAVGSIKDALFDLREVKLVPAGK
jgi:hypothetical protein